MSFVEDILKRANIQGLREYLLGGDAVEISAEDRDKQITDAYHNCIQTAERYGFKEGSDLFDAISQALNVYECVYLEIGVQAGFYLASNIYNDGGRWE